MTLTIRIDVCSVSLTMHLSLSLSLSLPLSLSLFLPLNVYSPDVILRGWLDSKQQQTNKQTNSLSDRFPFVDNSVTSGWSALHCRVCDFTWTWRLLTRAYPVCYVPSLQCFYAENTPVFDRWGQGWLISVVRWDLHEALLMSVCVFVCVYVRACVYICVCACVCVCVSVWERS